MQSWFGEGKERYWVVDKSKEVELATTSQEPSNIERVIQYGTSNNDDDNESGQGAVNNQISQSITFWLGEPSFKQQERLLQHPKRYQLEAFWKDAIERDPISHVAMLGRIASHTFQQGRPAQPWTAGGVHGPSICSYDNADYSLLTEDEFRELWPSFQFDRPVVIRDEVAKKRKAILSTDDYLSDLASLSNSLVDVQSYDSENGIVAQTISGAEAQRRWDEDSNNLPKHPINLLDLGDHTSNLLPDAFTAFPSCMLLQRLCGLVDSVIYTNIKGLQRSEAHGHGPGKKHVQKYTATDIQSCQRFRIIGQRGSISGWHMDNLGVITYAKVAGRYAAGTSKSQLERDEDIIKYWPFFPISRLSIDERELSLQAFVEHGLEWKPTPSCGIPILALVKGDTLVMPPGTIHAPITLMDASMAGGMCMDEGLLLEHLRWWCFLSKHPQCTNEEPPKQTHAIIKMMKEWVNKNPLRYKIESAEQREAFEKACLEICGYAVQCDCKGPCRSRCNCVRWEVPCGIMCHPARKECVNSHIES
jgi:hypothetical protein